MNGNLLFDGEYLYGHKKKCKEYIKGKLVFEGDYICDKKWNGIEYDLNDGEIISARIIEGNNGESRGYGFVLYKEAECAAKAIKEANGKKLKDGTKNLIVCMFEKNRKKNPIKFNNIYVKNK